MTDGVHRAMEEVQPAELQTTIDGARPNSQRHDLPARDDAMLALGKRRDLTVDRTRLRFAPYSDVNLNVVGHPPMVAGEP